MSLNQVARSHRWGKSKTRWILNWIRPVHRMLALMVVGRSRRREDRVMRPMLPLLNMRLMSLSRSGCRRSRSKKRACIQLFILIAVHLRILFSLTCAAVVWV